MWQGGDEFDSAVGDDGDEPEFATDAHSYEDVRRNILSGMTATDLAALLRVSPKTIEAALGAVEPVGTRRNRPLYAVADVAPLVVKPSLDLDRYIRRLKPKDLPPSLQKAFWDAQEARQSYEQKAGHLWHTHRVQQVIGRLMMIARQHLVLGTDSVDRLAPLSDEQRQLVQLTFDIALAEMQKTIDESFKDYDGKGDRQETYEHGPPEAMLNVHEEPEAVGDGLDL